MWGAQCRQGLCSSLQEDELWLPGKTAEASWDRGGVSIGECRGEVRCLQTRWRVFSISWFPQVSVYLGWGVGEAGGTCQPFCSWRSLPKIPAPPAHTLRLVSTSPFHIP